MSELEPIPLSAVEPFAPGLRRPEDVVVSGDGRVFASDGDDLYIGSIGMDRVAKVRSPVPGVPLVHQR